jgi:DNA-binding FadR family transcriptional regulator
MAEGSAIPFGKNALAERLELEIHSGALKPGDRLPSERQLVATYSVSRSVVREVLSRLEERGLIESAPGRGSFVRAADPRVVRDSLDTILRRRAPTPHHVVEARLLLEARTARLAAENAEQSDLDDIRAALEEFDSARDVVTRARADVEFHAAVVRASHNPVFEFMFTSISTMTFELMLRSLSDTEVSREAVPLHKEVLEAITSGDADTAAQLMIRHLEVAQKLYGPDLDERLDLVTQRRAQQLLSADL